MQTHTYVEIHTRTLEHTQVDGLPNSYLICKHTYAHIHTFTYTHIHAHAGGWPT